MPSSLLSIESPGDSILQEDLEYIANNSPALNKIKNSTVLVTGATGLIGSQIVKALSCSNRINNTNIKIIPFVRNEKKARNVFGAVLDRDESTLAVGDIINPINIPYDIDYIIHGASVTSSKEFVEHPVGTIKTCLDGTRNILELAKEKQVKGMVYLSSMEVYGVTDCGTSSVTENDYGLIDFLNVRSSYSEGKRMAECMCAAYAHEYKAPVKMARLAQTFGAGVSCEENRVFAQFAKSVINKTDIVLRTKGETVSTYCCTKDAILAVLLLLQDGIPGEAYNVANMSTSLSIKDMANMVADRYKEANIKVILEVCDDISKYGYPKTTRLNINSEKLQNLGWKPTVCLEEMYDRLIESMLNSQNGEV